MGRFLRFLCVFSRNNAAAAACHSNGYEVVTGAVEHVHGARPSLLDVGLISLRKWISNTPPPVTTIDGGARFVRPRPRVFAGWREADQFTLIG